MAPLSKSVPPTLKKIVVFLRRAEELDHDKAPESRVVAYNCRQYAVLTGIPLAGSDAAAKSCLSKLLDELEKEKNAMLSFSKAEHLAICRQVANRVFDKADGEDRAGLADKGTAKTFYAAGTFYEILQQFHDNQKDCNEDKITEQEDEEEQKRLYCKWKATDILNAIKEGRKPISGGYQQQDDESGDADIPEQTKLTATIVEPTIITETSSFVKELPPTPEIPSSDFSGIENTNKDTVRSHDSHIVSSPSYDNVELNINGSLVENAHDEDDSNDVVIPVALKNTSVELPPVIPPPYTESGSSPYNKNSDIPAESETIIPEAPISSPGALCMFSSLFSTSNSTKPSKNQMNDAIELTKFALAALQKGDGELGRQRLEQALAVLNK